MPTFTCYKLRDLLNGRPPVDLDEYIDLDEQRPETYGPEEWDDFTAKLYIRSGPLHPPGWGHFVRAGFSDMSELPLTASAGAVIILKLKPENRHFAFTFGSTGRFLLKQEAWERGYGLQAALNLIYPRDGHGSPGRLVAVDAKRRSGDIIRSRRQASKATAFEAFDIDKVRDLVGGATGKPNDPLWGKRITGTDALHFEADREFALLGKLCKDLEAAHDKDDYKDRFSWLDAIRPIHDPVRLAAIEAHLIERLAGGDITDLDLAPPEIIDWSAVVGFRYHFEARKKFHRPELSLAHYLHGLAVADDAPDELDVEFLRRRSIRAVDSDNREVHKWSVWRCLTGEFEFAGTTYILDEGEIFAVSLDFMADLDTYISGVPVIADIAWPKAGPSMNEAEFNEKAALTLEPALLMDQKTVIARTQTTPIELCDILTADKCLIHVKRHFGSRDLSHLFSQGFVSACLLQEDLVFRQAANEKIKELTTNDVFGFFGLPTLHSGEFQVVFVVVANWGDRGPSQALPFFSKVNLRRTVTDLQNRGYRVALSRVNTG